MNIYNSKQNLTTDIVDDAFSIFDDSITRGLNTDVFYLFIIIFLFVCELGC
jgi:hypothetical protein